MYEWQVYIEYVEHFFPFQKNTKANSRNVETAMLALTWLQKANTITEIVKTFTIFVLENALRNTKAIKNPIAYPVTNLKWKGKEYWPQLEAKNITTFVIKNAWMLTQSKLARNQLQVR